jgi:hypothetical protein
MAWIEHLRRSDPNYDLNAQQVPFGIQLRRVRAASQNPPLAKLRHFIADSGHRFITAQAQGKSVLAPDPLIPLVKDTAGFRIVQEGRTVSYYLFPETYEAEAVPDRWTAGQARLQLAHSGDIVSRGWQDQLQGLAAADVSLWAGIKASNSRGCSEVWPPLPK